MVEKTSNWRYKQGFYTGAMVGVVGMLTAQVLIGVADKLLSKPLGQLVDRIADFLVR